MIREANERADDNRKATAVPVRRNYEKFSATLLLSAGLIYLSLWIISVFSETSSFINVNDGKISMKMSELLSHVRTLITIAFSIMGGFLLFKRRRWGWILGITVLLLLQIICSGAVYQAIKLDETALIAIAGIAWLILFTSLGLLLLPSVRYRLRINTAAVATACVLSAILVIFYFFLQ